MRPTQTPPAGEPVVLSDATAVDFIEKNRYTLLAFMGDDLPSQRLRPRLELLAAKLSNPELAIGILHVDHDAQVAEALGIDRVPLTVLFVEGEVTDRLLGAVPEDVLEETVRARLR